MKKLAFNKTSQTDNTCKKQTRSTIKFLQIQFYKTLKIQRKSIDKNQFQLKKNSMVKLIVSKNEEIHLSKSIFDNFCAYPKKLDIKILIIAMVEVIFLLLNLQYMFIAFRIYEYLLSNLFCHYAYTKKMLSKWGYLTIYAIFITKQLYFRYHPLNQIDFILLQPLAALFKSTQLIFYILKATPLNQYYLKICFDIYSWYILFLPNRSYLVSLIQITVFFLMEKIQKLTKTKYQFLLLLILFLNWFQTVSQFVIFCQFGQILSIAIYINEKNNLKQRTD
ncbi:transmembrane protein, putative (macronuclear) [Tetrahymena thermophila SB210]|uniref:Transmembrane protein, putative n=1 Tax=Tetrahymena thermophila (strain SB210) TaxID=312017 RepID=W7XJS6_TETTS|nr:transmembrane protein, putative [Tetrahymena thermophila SB210]EWS75906.1 transmembrane protein, putative [Tetrahymena thermophila SB210]|eukprot:XP_012651560.1 transmembrane protein, putative [Tetrahymena thermophila SB210]